MAKNWLQTAPMLVQETLLCVRHKKHLNVRHKQQNTHCINTHKRTSHPGLRKSSINAACRTWFFRKSRVAGSCGGNLLSII